MYAYRFLMLVCSVKMIVNFIPNLFTLCNLLCGVVGIYLCFHQAMPQAAILIFVGGFFDFFDGLIARLLGAHSELGKELDSLADMVTFGVLPGLIMFNLLLSSQGYYFSLIEEIPLKALVISFTALLIPMMAALRLAKFNIDDTQTDHFLGLPTPAVAIFVAGLPIALEFQYYLNVYTPHSLQEFIALAEVYYWFNYDIGIMLLLTNKWFYAVSSIVLSALMVLPVPILAFKFKSFKWSDNSWRFSFLLLAISSIAFAFIHEIVSINGLPYIQWVIIPILIAELVVVSLIKNVFGSND